MAADPHSALSVLETAVSLDSRILTRGLLLSHSPTKILTSSSYAVMTTVMAVTAFVFILGMPWNDLGLWRQVEVPAAAIHLAGALCLIAIGILVGVKDERAIGTLRHPAVLLLIALPIFTMLVAPFTDSPWRSIHGTLKHGAGALWYFEIALMTVAASLVLRSKAAVVLEAALVTSTLLIIALYSLPDTTILGLPMSFAEWVGLQAAAVSFVIVSRGRKFISFRSALALLLLVLGIVVSDNRTVMLSVVAVGILLAAFQVPVISDLFKKPNFRTGFVVACGLLGVVAMAVLAPALEHNAQNSAPPATSANVLSTNPIDKYALQDSAFGTLWSRSHMVRMVIADISQNPVDLLVGRGWGSFATVYEYHARDIPGRVFPVPTPTSSQTYWDAQKMADFHSHDLPIEALLSGGLVAFVLWFATVGALARTSRTGLLMASGVTVSALLWFPINHMTVAIAALLATGIAPVAVGDGLVRRLSRAVAIPVAIMSAALIVVAAQAFAIAQIEHAERYFQPINADRNVKTCGAIGSVLMPEDEINISLYDVLTQRIVNSKNKAKEVYDKTTNVITLSCTLRSYYGGSDNIRALVVSLEKRALLVGIGPASYGPMLDDILNWSKDVDRLLELAPQRTEHVVPYLAALSQRSKNKDLLMKEIERYSSRMDHNDPIYEYLLALKARQLSDPAGFREHLKKAVKLGYANIYAVPLEQAKEFDLL